MRPNEGYLFPDNILSNRIHSFRYTAAISGDFFESLSEVLLPGGLKYYDDGPDGRWEEGLWESKSGQNIHDFKLTKEQTDNYLNIEPEPVFYLFWSYYIDRKKKPLTKACDTVRDLLLYLCKNVERCFVVPPMVLERLMEEEEVVERSYKSWQDASGNPYNVYKMPHRLLDRVRWNCRFPNKTTLKRLSVQYFGERFKTRTFPLIWFEDPKPDDGFPF